MAMYPGIPSITTAIMKRDGRHVTQIWKNGVIVKEVPTHASQIRPERVSCLWKPSKKNDGEGRWPEQSY